MTDVKLPEPAAVFHVQLFRECPSMRNVDLVEQQEFSAGSHDLFTADQLTAAVMEARSSCDRCERAERGVPMNKTEQDTLATVVALNSFTMVGEFLVSGIQKDIEETRKNVEEMKGMLKRARELSDHLLKLGGSLD